MARVVGRILLTVFVGVLLAWFLWAMRIKPDPGPFWPVEVEVIDTRYPEWHSKAKSIIRFDNGDTQMVLDHWGREGQRITIWSSERQIYRYKPR